MAYDQSNVIEIVHVQSMGGQVILNVNHWQLKTGEGPGNLSTLVALVQQLHARWGALAPLLSTDYQLVGSVGRVVTSKANVDPVLGTGTLVYGDQYEYLGVSPIIGEKAGDRLPTYASVRTIKRTDRTGRRYRGASRIAGTVEADTTGDRINDDYRINLQLAIDAYFAEVEAPPVIGVDHVAVVFSKKDYFQNELVIDSGAFTGLILTWVVRFALGTQNSRKIPGSGFSV